MMDHARQPFREPVSDSISDRDFGFVEKGTGRQQERLITPVFKPQPIDVEKAAKQFFSLAISDRRSSLREPEAAFFNRLVRAICARNIRNPRKFFTEFKDILVTLAGSPPRLVDDKGEKINVTQYFEKNVLGIEAVLHAISELQKQFRHTIRPGELRQMIGTNDLLDAAHKIDLVEMHYQAREAELDVALVRFVQVKRGGKPLSQEEREEIHRAHARYLSELSPSSSVALSRKQEAEEFVLSGAYFDQEMKNRQKSFPDLIEFSLHYFEPFLLELFSGPEEPDDESFETMFHLTSSSIQPTVAKIFFLSDQAEVLCLAFGAMAGESSERTMKLVGFLREWIARHAPSAKELRSLNPAWKAESELIPLIRFESAIMEGNDFITQPLELDTSRVLTRRKK